MSSSSSSASASASAPPPSPSPSQPSNWLSEWRSRTPLVVRFSIMVVLPITVISLLFSLSSFTGLVPFRATARFEIWRLITSLLDQGGIFTLLFVLLMLGTQMPAQEIRAGSVSFLAKLLFTGLLINVAFTAISMMLYLIGGNDPSSFFKFFAITPSQGLWPVLMSSITTNALSDPTGSSSFLCLTIPNRLYPWFLVFIFSFISMFPLLDLFTGVVVGHLQHYKFLDFLNLSPRTISTIETGTGLAVRLGMTTKEGFIYGPATVLPPGARQLDRETAEAQWAAFDPIARQRLQQQQQRQQQQQQGGGYGDEESGSSASRFHTIPARGRSTPGSTSSTTQTNGSGSTSTTGAFIGEGHSLGGNGSNTGGRDNGEQDGGFTTSSGPPSSVSSIIGSLFGRGGGGSSLGYSAVDTTGVLGSPDHNSLSNGSSSGGSGGGGSSQGVSVEDRRRAAAAAAEARIRALDTRGINAENSPRSQQQIKREIDRIPLMEGRNGTSKPNVIKKGNTDVNTVIDEEFNGEDVDLLYAPVVNNNITTTRAGTSTTTTTAPSNTIPSRTVIAAPSTSSVVNGVVVNGNTSSSTTSSKPSFVSQSDVQSLVEMGFNKDEAINALTKSRGDMGRALELLTEES